MIDMKKATAAMGRLSALKFFPADPAARAEIVLMASRMATDNAQIDWLASRCVALWNEWEGPREMRAVFCSRFKPADGVESYSNLPQFADGIPSERDTMQIAGAPRLALPAGSAPDPAFPTDVTALLNAAIARSEARGRKLPTADETAEIARLQEAQRKHRDRLPAEMARLEAKCGE